MFTGSSANIQRSSETTRISGFSTTTGKFGTVTIQNGKSNPIIVTTDWD
jgi:hypothetical protein